LALATLRRVIKAIVVAQKSLRGKTRVEVALAVIITDAAAAAAAAAAAGQRNGLSQVRQLTNLRAHQRAPEPFTKSL
jgi:hypothetical protein